MDLNEILVFAKVVEAGSFVGAARALGMPTSTVSRKVAGLEARLGARLLQRTTRSLRLTEVGRTYYQHAQRVAEELDAADRAVTEMEAAPRGLLRVTTPINFGFLGETVARFLERYPEVEIDLHCADRVVDLVEEGFDVAVRAGRLADSSLVARSLGVLRSYVVASPAFLARAGSPRTPDDLEGFDCVVLGAGADWTKWRLRRDGGIRAVKVRPRLTVNDFDFLEAAAKGGLGVAMLPTFRCAPLLADGTLVRILDAWCSPDTPLHAVYPSTRHLSPKVTAFLDHLQGSLTPAPWDVGGP